MTYVIQVEGSHTDFLLFKFQGFFFGLGWGFLSCLDAAELKREYERG